MKFSLLWPSISVIDEANYSDNDFVTQNGFIDFGQTTFKDGSGFDIDTQSLVFLVELSEG